MFPAVELDNLRDFMKLSRKKVPNAKFKVLAIYEKKEMVGGIVFDYYKNLNTLLIEYISTRPGCRGKGYASKLVDYVTQKFKPDYTIIEVENPNHVVGDEPQPLCNRSITSAKALPVLV